MKVILFVSGFPSKKEPARSAFNYAFASSLVEKKIEVTVVYIRTLTFKRPILLKYFYDKIEVIEFSCVIPYSKGTLKFKFFSYFSSRVKDKIKFCNLKTVVHCVGGGNIPFASEFALKYDLPLLSQFIGSDVNVYLQNYLKEKAFLRGIKNSNWFVFNSKSLLGGFFSKIKINLETPSQVIYRGVDLEAFLFRVKRVQDEIRILYLGGFPKNDINLKGGLDLLESIKLLNSIELRINLRFEIGGPNSLELDLSQFLNNKIQIDLIGAVAKSIVQEKFSESHVVIIPSIKEGLPNVLYESMATGNLVIASEVGGIPEVLDNETGIIIKPNSPKLLSEVIYELQLHPESIYTKSMKAREKVLNFKKENAITNYIDVYQKLLKNR
jgi:glycosyltransferase involved in cell wall biosynthesis